MSVTKVFLFGQCLDGDSVLIMPRLASTASVGSDEL